MTAAVRDVAPYSPDDDLRLRFPEWDVVRVGDLPVDVGEVMLPKRKTILLSRCIHDADPEYAIAHLIAHLDLHKIGGPFTKAQEDEARMLALWRLDREDDREVA